MKGLKKASTPASIADKRHRPFPASPAGTATGIRLATGREGMRLHFESHIYHINNILDA
jgi:hypothetical protein